MSSLSSSSIINEPMLFTDPDITSGENIDLWNTFRKHMKTEKDLNKSIFLYGKPTEKIMTILTRLYYENQNRIKNLSKSTVDKPTKFMCGILELENGTILVTISEDPSEDSEFLKKKNQLILMLKNSNCPVKEAIEDKEPKSTMSESINTKDITTMNQYANSRSQNKDTKVFMEEEMPLIFINSEAYLKRRKEGESFIPAFKKDKKGKNTMACNNGSTCVESKFFSFIKDQLGMKFRNIKGFVSYWIGDKVAPNHILTSYCYEDGVNYETENLKKLMYECWSKCDTKIKRFISKQINTDSDTSIFKHIVNPLSIPCPGCVYNWQAYTSLEYIKWNYEQCNIGRARNKDTMYDPNPLLPGKKTIKPAEIPKIIVTSVSAGGRRYINKGKNNNNKNNQYKKTKKIKRNRNTNKLKRRKTIKFKRTRYTNKLKRRKTNKNKTT